MTIHIEIPVWLLWAAAVAVWTVFMVLWLYRRWAWWNESGKV